LDGNGTWSLDSNWAGTSPNGTNAATYFGPVILAPRVVTLDAPKTVGALNFDSAIGYTLAGPGTITMDVSSTQAGIVAAINVMAGSHTISTPLVLNADTAITVDPVDSVLYLTGTLTASGRAITKDGFGVAQFENIRAASLNVVRGTAMVRPRSAGSPNSPDGVSRLGSLSIASGAALDLTNNSAIIDYTSVGTLVDDVRQHLRSGRITSSMADAAHRLGYGDNSVLLKNSFEGQDVSTHQNVLIKYTYAGDTNLDGEVDVADLTALAQHWQSPAVWTGGDFNYNGIVDVSDLLLLAQNWQAGVASPLPAGSLSAALTSLNLPAVVPEPGSWAIISLSMTGMLATRRRR
jgi:hypothetical protein